MLEEGRLPPSIIFVHGAGAHAHWFAHIANFFVQDFFSVVSISQSGHGDSGHREHYDESCWANELVDVAKHAGLVDKNRVNRPILVAHSVGSFVAEHAARSFPRLFGGLVVVDGGIPHPITWSGLKPGDKPPWAAPPRKQPKVYNNSIDPVARFRLAPPQEAPSYIVEYIARHSSKASDGGWVWKFDPNRETKTDFVHLATEIGTPAVVNAINEHTPVAVIYGEESIILSPSTVMYMRHHLGECIPVIGIPSAQHHVFLDQPLAFVAALKAILAEWARGGKRQRASWSAFDGDENSFAKMMKEGAMSLFQPFKKPAATHKGARRDARL
jgi:pimeloyl-ACP methyl ester carboxylesterase